MNPMHASKSPDPTSGIQRLRRLRTALMGSWAGLDRWALPMAFLFSCLRLGFLGHDAFVQHEIVTLGNLGIQMLVLGGLALLVNHTARLATHVAKLEKLLPIYAWCKRIRKEDGSWMTLESYFASQTEVVLTHGICPECGHTFSERSSQQGSNGGPS